MKRLAIWSGVSLAACVTLYFAAHQLGEPDPPLWSEVDLPQRPPEESNGWVAVTKARDFERADWALELPADFDSVDWSDWRHTNQELTRELEVDPERDELWNEVLERPRFVDACDFRIDVDCHLGRVLDFWDESTLVILKFIEMAHWDLALPRLDALWERTIDYASHTRGVVSAFVALRLVDTVLPVFAMLMLSAGEDADPAALRTMADDIEQFEFPAESFQNALKGDYVEKWQMLGLGETSLLFDRGHTLRMMGRDYETVIDYAATRGRGTRPNAPPHTERSLWWLYNAAGKGLLDILDTVPDLVARVDSFENGVREIETATRVVGAGLRDAADRVEREAEASGLPIPSDQRRVINAE